MEAALTHWSRDNGHHFADDILKCIFLNENVWIPIKISLKFVPKGPINNIPAMVQIMAWRRSGDKPLSEPMVVSLPTHICVARPQWVNLSFNNWVSLYRMTGAPVSFDSFAMHFGWFYRLIFLLCLKYDRFYSAFSLNFLACFIHPHNVKSLSHQISCDYRLNHCINPMEYETDKTMGVSYVPNVCVRIDNFTTYIMLLLTRWGLNKLTDNMQTF